MPETIITLYCFFDELLQALGHKDDVQAQLSTAEVMTIALVAAEFFTGNQQKALDFLTSHGDIAPLSKSRFQESLQPAPAPNPRNALADGFVRAGPDSPENQCAARACGGYLSGPC